MRKLVLTAFFLLVLFGLNLIFYGFNEDYRFFVKKLKYSWEVVEINDAKTISDTDNFEDSEIATVKPEVITVPDTPETQLLTLWDNEKKILSKFFSYELERVLIYQSLFDLTSEYPDDYFEYIGIDGDIVLYMFPTREYDQILEVFDVISYDLPFEINAVNNFWEASFYINVDEEFSDDFVRLVIKSVNGVFWLKIKKDLYNDTKEILKNI